MTSSCNSVRWHLLTCSSRPVRATQLADFSWPAAADSYISAHWRLQTCNSRPVPANQSTDVSRSATADSCISTHWILLTCSSRFLHFSTLKKGHNYNHNSVWLFPQLSLLMSLDPQLPIVVTQPANVFRPTAADSCILDRWCLQTRSSRPVPVTQPADVSRSTVAESCVSARWRLRTHSRRFSYLSPLGSPGH